MALCFCYTCTVINRMYVLGAILLRIHAELMLD